MIKEKINIEEQIKAKIEGLFEFKSITNVNHNPHPFMIGSKHIMFCSENYGGILGDSCIQDKRFPTCSHPGCNLGYESHTSDKVLFLSLLKDLAEDTAQSCLLSLKGILEADKIDGISFVETPEKYRFK